MKAITQTVNLSPDQATGYWNLIGRVDFLSWLHLLATHRSDKNETSTRPTDINISEFWSFFISILMMETELVYKTLVFNRTSTWQITGGNFIAVIYHESFKCYTVMSLLYIPWSRSWNIFLYYHPVYSINLYCMVFKSAMCIAGWP
jgi:hypothetical protein